MLALRTLATNAAHSLVRGYRGTYLFYCTKIALTYTSDTRISFHFYSTTKCIYYFWLVGGGEEGKKTVIFLNCNGENVVTNLLYDNNIMYVRCGIEIYCEPYPFFRRPELGTSVIVAGNPTSSAASSRSLLNHIFRARPRVCVSFSD